MPRVDVVSEPVANLYYFYATGSQTIVLVVLLANYEMCILTLSLISHVQSIQSENLAS